ncbi:EamA family transporter [Rudanella paleaurantiibacter]|uniref:EamA family transporter n=1 Tax=Rudanella paleaurantiibacter TaxID=2614655 RepID=A0A7J5U519_9BACT|nr:DMT family transporter [Rudanella paleaurantiibacter]KAB7732866.1 EamA family transporter [Rudanella paleaurantiibacter]
MQTRTADYLHLHFIVLIWGFTAILGKLLDPLSPLAVVLYRTLLAVIGMGAVLWYGHRNENPVAPVSSRDRWRLLGVGAIIAVHWMAFFAAARLANVSVCLAGMATSSLWASVLEPLLLRRRVRPVEVLLGAVVMGGLYLIFRFEFDKVGGLLAAILSAMLGALFTIINSQFTHRYEALVISTHEMAGAFLTSVPLVGLYSLIWGQPTDVFWPQSGAQWGWLLLLAWVCTVYAYTAGVRLLRKFSAYLAILTVNLEPVYGILLAVLIFGDTERMTTGFYLGTLVILVAVIGFPFLANKEK